MAFIFRCNFPKDYAPLSHNSCLGLYQTVTYPLTSGHAIAILSQGKTAKIVIYLTHLEKEHLYQPISK